MHNLTISKGRFLKQPIVFLCCDGKESTGKILSVGYLLILVMLLFFSLVHAQDDSSFVFQGQLLDENSLPIENVSLINYRNLEFFRTDKNGRFHGDVLPGDSLMTYHISYEPLIVKACESDTLPVYQLAFQVYELFESNVSVAVKQKNIYDEILLNNFNDNWDRMFDHMQTELSYGSVREKSDRANDSTMEDGQPLVSNFDVNGRGGVNAGLSIEGICDGVKSIKNRLKGG